MVNDVAEVKLKTISSIGRREWLLLLGLLAAFVALVLLAPPEKTLGEAIRTVYVHVALTRAGIWGFYVAGLLGLVVAITARERLQEWTRVVTWVSLALFFAGGIGSIFAQQSSWGGLLWEEPRNRTSLSVIAAALAVLVLIQWIPWIRVRGLLVVGLAGYVAWIIPRTPLVFHPANAIGSSPSATIRWAFLALTLIACLIGVWFVWVLGRGER
jgi:hypothetical protein